jgi:hypothetical protein
MERPGDFDEQAVGTDHAAVRFDGGNPSDLADQRLHARRALRDSSRR